MGKVKEVRSYVKGYAELLGRYIKSNNKTNDGNELEKKKG